MELTVLTVLIVVGFVLTILAAIRPAVPLWIPVLFLYLIWMLYVLPKGQGAL